MKTVRLRMVSCVLATGRFLWRILKIVGEFLAKLYRDFDETRCTTRAAALSYTTILAVVPLLAVSIAVSKNFLRDASEEEIPRALDRLITTVIPMIDWVPEEALIDSLDDITSVPDAAPVKSRAARDKIITGITDFIEHINFRALGAVGMLALLFVGVRLIETIENTMNDIWGVGRGRGRLQRLVYYWTAITLGPLVLLFSISASTTWSMDKLDGLPILKVIPQATSNLLVLSLLFGLLYYLLPNTHVKFHAALAGGMVGGALWRLNSMLSALYFRRVVTYSAIYGSIGLIPVILVGIYFAWLIFLLGAQVSYTVQHIREYRQEKVLRRVNQAAMEFISIHLMLLISRRFINGDHPPGTELLAKEMSIPERVAREIVDRLVLGSIIVPVSMEKGSQAYQPARDPNRLRILDIISVMRTAGADWLDTVSSEEHAYLKTLMERIQNGALQAGGNTTIVETLSALSGSKDE